MNILITGASRGIGVATAKQLAKKGIMLGCLPLTGRRLSRPLKTNPLKVSQKTSGHYRST